ncbi:MAG: hypothetical protein HW421_3792 [Ignavibacteria bacterium]|nr:hypothetical protein [Ignavibacteria bacterium]
MITTLGFLFTFLSFYLALRVEIKKHSDTLLQTKISEEKRHANSEARLSVIENHLAYEEASISEKLDEIKIRLNELNDLFIDHLRDNHYD